MKITGLHTMRLRFPPGPSHSDAQHHFGNRSGLAIRIETDADIAGHGYIYLGVSPYAIEAVQVGELVTPRLVSRRRGDVGQGLWGWGLFNGGLSGLLLGLRRRLSP